MYQTRPRKSYYKRKTKPPKPPKPIKVEEIYHIKNLDMPNRIIQWDCECGYKSHEYFITCPICSKENPLNGKGMKR